MTRGRTATAATTGRWPGSYLSSDSRRCRAAGFVDGVHARRIPCSRAVSRAVTAPTPADAARARLSKFSVLAVSSSSHLRAFFILERASPLSPLSVFVFLASPSSSLSHGEPTISALQVRARDSSAFFPSFPPSAPSTSDNRTILPTVRKIVDVLCSATLFPLSCSASHLAFPGERSPDANF